jgi:hypothetical protein
MSSRLRWGRHLTDRQTDRRDWCFDFTAFYFIVLFHFNFLATIIKPVIS